MIGKLLKIMRLHKNLSLKELSTQICVDVDLLLQYEEGLLEPDFEMVLKIANACGYEIEFVKDDDFIQANKEI